MGVTIQEDMYEAAQYMPEDHRGPFIAALVGYGLTGELPDESEPWYPTFYVCKSRLDMSAEASIRNREAGIASGRARRKRSSKQDTNTRSNTCSDDSGTDAQTDVNTCSDTRSNSRSNTPSTPVRTEVRRGEESRGKERDIPSRETARLVISHLNEVAGTSFRANSDKALKHIGARLNDGFSADDMISVIDRKCSQWLGTDMAKFLRPETLFGPKFEGYLNEPTPNTQGGDPDDYYDFSALDRRSMGDADADLPF